MSKSAELNVGGNSYKLPLIKGTENEVALDISLLRRESKLITIDPGYGNTGSCKSQITFIDGEKGILRYRGINIEELAVHSSFLETAWLLINGELPNQETLKNFADKISSYSELNDSFKQFFKCFPRKAHPMAVTGSMVGALATFYTDDSIEEGNEQIATFHLIGKVASIVAFAYKHSIGEDFINPQYGLDYSSNFLYMLFKNSNNEYLADPIVSKTMDLLFLLHSDHEQNCSTSTVRIVGSSQVNIFSAITAGINALWGPLHGGANQAVIEMLDNILISGDKGKDFLEKIKNKKTGLRMMGFGHRVYKSFDPRALLIKKACFQLLKKLNVESPLLDLALQLEENALNDEYFIERKLYPNVDFYSGIILNAIGLPVNMFTTLFVIGRIPGWIAQWNEMKRDPDNKIARPRQLYTGENKRSYVVLKNRK